jgi:tetratricopeptide (TPR) repeat protein
MAKMSFRNIFFLLLIIIAAAFLSFVFIYCFRVGRLGGDIFVSDERATEMLTQDAVAVTRELLSSLNNVGERSKITIDYPFDESVFPSEIVAPTFLWHDEDAGADLWLIEVVFASRPHSIYVITAGVQAEPYIDPEAVSSTNEHYKRSDYDISARAWTPDGSTWRLIKDNCVEESAALTIFGFSSNEPSIVLSKGGIEFVTSGDAVGAAIFYRDVPLMPSETMEGVIKPIAKSALPLISWRLRDISEPDGSVILKDMPTCANCHTFSKDGKVLGMDMDGPGGDKGAYGLTEVEDNIVITYDDIITWNSYEHTPKGHKNFGLFSQVSPDGRYVISTLNESTFVVNYPDFKFLQSFYPTRGILVFYDRQTGRMKALAGADNPEYVHGNGCWSPDGTHLVFSRAEAKDNYGSREMATYAGDERETFIQYDLYEIPFNEGRGGEAVAIKGASQNGMSNSFARYSPDGKWIVFVQSSKGQLMRPDSKLYIIPSGGGAARQMDCNLALMNSWHSWSPNSRWLVFASKGFTPFTQMFLTHIDENGEDTPAILIPNATAANRAVNIPEFLNGPADSILSISTPTQESYRHYNNATELAKSNMLVEALGEMEKSLELHPFYANAHHDKGFILFKMGRDKEAIDCFKRAIELESDYAKAYNSIGFVLESQGKVEQAIEYYNRALEVNPAQINSLCNLGNILRSQGRLDEAAGYYRKALEIKPYLTEAHSNLGVVLQSQGKLGEAIDCYERALELEGDYVPAHYNIGLVRQSQGRVDEAVDCFRKALEFQADYTPARYSLGAILQAQGNVEGAIEEYRVIVQQDSGHVDAHYNLAVLLAKTNQLEQAFGHFRRVLEINPNHADAHYHVGGILYRGGKTELAVEHLRRAVQIKADYTNARIALADILLKQNEIKEAVEHYEFILEVEPEHLMVLNVLAWTLATTSDTDLHDVESAVELAKRACELTDYEQPAVLDTLAAAYAAVGAFERAIETANKAFELATAGGEPGLAERVKSRLELYKAGRPYRD